MDTRAFVARHEALLGRMARTLGLDLNAEMEAGKIGPAGMDQAVARCMGCDDPEGCALWLDQRAAGAAHTPGLCANKSLLERLRRSL